MIIERKYIFVMINFGDYLTFTFFSLLNNVIIACVWNGISWKLFLFLQRFKQVEIQLKVQLCNKT